jgi:KDO2-lipid IV(A) lauroyltransferase
MNLQRSFPEKSKKELRRIERQYYLHFADMVVETLKLLHISDKEIQKRMYFSNPEEIRHFFDEKKSVIILLGHYGNWEWVTSIYLHYSGIIGGELYRPMKNKRFDRFFLQLRKRFGTVNIPKNDALREIARFRRDGKVFGLGFIADQTPSVNNLHYWNLFLNQDTPFLNGPERIARQGGYAVAYLDVQKKKRGYYTCEIIMVTEDGKQTKENEITDQYVKLFEQTIRRNPAYWLWSHKRWKYKRSAPMNL